jgi:hypothetical protein
MKYQRLDVETCVENEAVAAVWPTAALDKMAPPATAATAKTDTFAGTPAMAGVAIGVCRLIVGSYAALILVFFALFANSPAAMFAIAICAFFVGMFFAVPRIFLVVEAAPQRRPSFDRFMRTGLATLTGRTGGRDALLQMLIVPVLLTLGLAAMGVIGKIYIG